MENQIPDTQVRDEDKLAELGYRQDLNRDWTLLHNFGVSFSIIVRQYQCTPGKAETDCNNRASSQA